MNTIPAFQSGLTGIQSGLDKLSTNSATIASSSNPQQVQDVTHALVDMMSNKQQIEASAKVIEASSNTVGTLLDITV